MHSFTKLEQNIIDMIEGAQLNKRQKELLCQIESEEIY